MRTNSKLIDEMWQRTRKLFDLAGACNGELWETNSKEVSDYLTYMCAEKNFVGYDMRRLIMECERLQDLLYDPNTGNVFADFLEERGYSDAAMVLRKEFPISSKVEDVSSDG